MTSNSVQFNLQWIFTGICVNEVILVLIWQYSDF